MLFVLLLLVGGVVWASQSVIALVYGSQGNARKFAIVYVGGFLLLAWQTILAYLERPIRLTGRQQARVDRLRVTVNVPVHNEAPSLLAACLWSLLRQTRPPERSKSLSTAAPSPTIGCSPSGARARTRRACRPTPSRSTRPASAWRT